MSLVAEAIGIGLVLSLLFADTIGFVAGGMVVPGYIALILTEPKLLAGTLFSAFLTLFFLHLISQVALIYGKRRLALAVLIGFILAEFTRLLARQEQFPILQLEAFGYVIPGLLAHWMERQGILPTLALTLIAGIIIRLCLVLLHNGYPI